MKKKIVKKNISKKLILKKSKVKKSLKTQSIKNRKAKVGRIVMKKPQTRKKIVDDIYEDYISYYYDYGYKGDGLDTSSRSINWGVGVEHETQFFHISKKGQGIKDSNILFDAQESTCYLTNDKSSKGSCCHDTWGKNKCLSDHPILKKITKDRVKLPKEDIEWLKKIPWEYSGRQQKGCDTKDPEAYKIILKRARTLMPEFVTGNHVNRTMESIYQEILFMEKKFIDLQMKNPYTRQKVKKYGEIRTLPYGAVDNILVPIKPSMGIKDYTFYATKYLDYIGSYHVNITLPCPEDITNKDFVKLHQNFANQIQWIEPLLLATLFSGDPRAISREDYEKKIRGSFRMLATGWGNIAGSDIRKMGTGGVNRYGNIESNWRLGLNFPETKALNECNSRVRIKGAVGILSSDIRTFGYDYTPNCKKISKECPKVSGAKMVYPNGMEIRIFDHFNSAHLLDLLRLLVYLAENSRLFETKNYVYSNLSWKTTVRSIMRNGWRAIISETFLRELRKNLNLELNLINKTAYGVMTAVNEELFLKHKNGLFTSMLLQDKYKDPPYLIELNRFSWQISFNNKYEKYIKPLMKNNFKKGQKITMKQFETVLFTTFNKTRWKDYVVDILYALESKPYKMLELKYPEGEITSIKYI